MTTEFVVDDHLRRRIHAAPMRRVPQMLSGAYFQPEAGPLSRLPYTRRPASAPFTLSEEHIHD